MADAVDEKEAARLLVSIAEAVIPTSGEPHSFSRLQDSYFPSDFTGQFPFKSSHFAGSSPNSRLAGLHSPKSGTPAIMEGLSVPIRDCWRVFL